MCGRSFFIALAGGLACFPCLAPADNAVVPDKGFAASRYEALWTKSPFAVATPEGGTDSPDYVLVGIAQFDGVSYANLIDKQSQEHFLLGSDKPVRGLKLTSITRGHDPAGTLAIIQKNGESITLKLDQSGMNPGAGPNGNGVGVVPTNSVTLPGNVSPQNISPGMFRNPNSPPGVMPANMVNMPGNQSPQHLTPSMYSPAYSAPNNAPNSSPNSPPGVATRPQPVVVPPNPLRPPGPAHPPESN